MYLPMKGDYPQSGYPQEGCPQAVNPIPGAFPHGGFPPQGAFNQGGYLPQKTLSQGGYLPQGTFPQGGYLPPETLPQGGYLPQGGNLKGGYFPHGGNFEGGYLPQESNLEGGYMPQASLLKAGNYPTGAFSQGGYPQQGATPHGGNPSKEAPVKSADCSPGVYPSPKSDFPPEYPSGDYKIPTGAYVGPADLGEDGYVKNFDFNKKSIQRGFVRKVYAILMCQLLVTLGSVSLFTFHEPTKLWVMRNSIVTVVALVALFVCLMVMACCENMRRKAPMNFVCLGIFTLAESFLVGVVCVNYDSEAVIMAVGLTAAICFAITLFAMQTKFDFTVMGGGLFCALVILMLFGLIMIFIPKNAILSLVYASIGALLFSLYLIYDTQLMMGGKHKYTISPEEYIFAALNIYLDIINIFIYLLRIIGYARG